MSAGSGAPGILSYPVSSGIAGSPCLRAMNTETGSFRLGVGRGSDDSPRNASHDQKPEENETTARIGVVVV